MSKILIVGAGGQGGPCASILSRIKDVSEIRLGDINVDLAQKVADKIDSPKLTPLELDASRQADIAKWVLPTIMKSTSKGSKSFHGMS